MKRIVVYIIESPSSNDFLDNRREGESISKILSLSQVRNQYIVAIDEPGLSSAIDRTIQDYAQMQSNPSGRRLPFLHLSCHGNELGLVLSNGHLLPWDGLRDLLNRINKRFVQKGSFSLLTICLSTCCGLYAMNADNGVDPSPFGVLIASEKKVEWAEALIAYSVFYYNFIYRDSDPVESVRLMNQSIGKDNLFEAHPSKDYKKNFDERMKRAGL